ncbi:MAG: hypothetical protein WAN39_02005 [Candidatus Cybelea sp.]|jgi:hypothetical protein
MHGWGTWSASWTWSLALVAITIAIHASGIVLIGAASRRIGAKVLRQDANYADSATVAIALIVAVGFSLALLHSIESMIWAFVYVWLGALPSPADAALYSVDSMTTRGASGLVLAPEWRMMGAVEAGDGMLLFGISTAFLFYVMLHLWRDESHG